MNEPITLAQLWGYLLAMCAGIITISGAVAVIIKIIHKAKQPERTQNQKIEALEREITKINSRLEKGDRHFEADCQRMDTLEKAMRASNKVIIESLQALTAHALDGTNIKPLKEAEKAMNDYLIGKI